MPRTPLPIGTWGEISTRPLKTTKNHKPVKHLAHARFRDHDGKVRAVTATGTTKTAARTALLTKLQNRAKTNHSAELTAAHKINHLLDLWERRFKALVADGTRSPTSLDTYRRALNNHIRPAIGELHIAEATTQRLDTVLTNIKDHAGAPTAKTCRAVISGAMKLAVRYGAITTNPAREVDAIEDRPKNPPRALTTEEVTHLHDRLTADEHAVEADLPDLVTFMLATGVRIGEALAILWNQIDLEAGTVEITHTIARPPGEGLIRKPTKSRTGERLLTLRTWATTSLRARHSAGWLALVVGFAASIPTSASGLADFLTLGRRHPARPAVVRHLLPALSTLPCFGAAIVLGHPSYHEGDIAPVPLILTIAGFVGLTAAGDAGGRLVFTQGLRVKNR